MIRYPRVVVNSDKLHQNARTVLSWCSAAGVDVALVGKCVCENSEVVTPLLQMGFSQLADSRIENLCRITKDIPKLLLRITMPTQAEETVLCADISLQSEQKTILSLNEAAEKHCLIHKVILMVDLGDLREGILFSDSKQLLDTARLIHEASNLELYGVGTNLTCYGSIVPDPQNLGILCQIAGWLEHELNIHLSVISGGNSSSLSLLRSGQLPERVNHLRIGEAILLGTDTATGKKFPELSDDAFVLEAQLVEVQEKPSFPIGTRSVDAFGKVRAYNDQGLMLRGILAVGRQDLPIEDLTPVDEFVSIVGGSSDHLIVDLKGSACQVGDILRFKLPYGALLGAFTSSYVTKNIQ